MTIETDPVTFARDQTADRLTDRFEDTGVEVAKRANCPNSVIISERSDRNVLVIEDELNDLGRGVSVREQSVTNPHDDGPAIELRLSVDMGLVALRQTVAHLNDELDVMESEIGDISAEVIVDPCVGHDKFFTIIADIQSAYDVRVDYLRGLDADQAFIVHVRPTAD